MNARREDCRLFAVYDYITVLYIVESLFNNMQIKCCVLFYFLINIDFIMNDIIILRATKDLLYRYVLYTSVLSVLDIIFNIEKCIVNY